MLWTWAKNIKTFRYSSPYFLLAMKVGQWSFDSSQTIYQQQQSWAAVLIPAALKASSYRAMLYCVKSVLKILVKFLKKYCGKVYFWYSWRLKVRNLTKVEHHFRVLKTPGFIFHCSSERLLLKIKAYKFVNTGQHAQVCMPIQTDLLKAGEYSK